MPPVSSQLIRPTRMAGCFSDLFLFELFRYYFFPHSLRLSPTEIPNVPQTLQKCSHLKASALVDPFAQNVLPTNSHSLLPRVCQGLAENPISKI